MTRAIVVLGMITKMPVAGVVWQYAHYLVGLRRLGWEPYYVETHGRTPSMLMARDSDDGPAIAAAFIGRVMRRFGLDGHWAYVDVHGGRGCLGMSRRELDRLYGRAAALVNMHGGTVPLPELAATGRLVYIDTDPAQLHAELSQGVRATTEFLDAHAALFTFAENHDGPECGLPAPDRYVFRATRQPVVLDLWPAGPGTSGLFTTIGNWRQDWRDITLAGERYTWSKHHEFLRVLDLPRRAGRRFELALSSYGEGDRRMLEDHGWRVRHALDFSADLDAYRDYIGASAAEFTVAKDQNVRLRTGWFSDRSATYLATGRPVVTQDTGLARILPTGRGLLPFDDLDGAAAAVQAVVADHAAHSRAARELAREHFAHEVVLGRLLEQLGLGPARPAHRRPPRPAAYPRDMVLEPVSRRPTRLPRETLRTVLERDVPGPVSRPASGDALTSVVVVTRDNLPFLRICVESLLADDARPPLELVVVDNGSTDGTASYLERLAARNPGVQVVAPGDNLGFAAGANRGLERAQGDALVLLNDDTAFAPGSLRRLLAALARPGTGLVGPVTNRIGNEAEVEAAYMTWGAFLDLAARRAAEHDGQTFELPTPAMFCVAMRPDVWASVGPLDERFEIGTLEDDDYALRVRGAGLQTLCAEDAFVHHFGGTSLGKLVAGGEYARIVARNRRRFEEKWGRPWRPYGRPAKPGYDALARRLRAAVTASIPPGAGVLVVARGDDELLQLDGRRGEHFPQAGAGGYAGHHPADSAEAIAELERLRASGAEYLVFPATSLWWLEHYRELGAHLDGRYRRVLAQGDTGVIFALSEGAR